MKKHLLSLLGALVLGFLGTGCVTQTESFTYDPALGPAYETVDPKKMRKKDGVFYSREANYSGGTPSSVSGHFY